MDESRGEGSTAFEGHPHLVVAIGGSAGALDACKRLFREMPAANGMAFVVAMLPDGLDEVGITEVLGDITEMPVVRVYRDELLEPDHVYVVAPESRPEIRAGMLHPSEAHDRPTSTQPLDELFSTLAADRSELAAGVVLSGVGNDGAAGIERLKAAGALCIAQSPETARCEAMPLSTIATGFADHVLPPESIPAVLLDFADRRDGAASSSGDSAPKELGLILGLVSRRFGSALKSYRTGTLKRRVERRMALSSVSDWHDYLERLRDEPDEVASLYQDLLVGYTRFFRDPEVWDHLSHDLLPDLIGRHVGETLRVWVPGCATGEEAYSLAIVFFEQVERSARRTKLRMYATDLSEEAIEKARRGEYPSSIAGYVSEKRLERFFRAKDHRFCIAPDVREAVTFGVHDLLRDPPFSDLHLVSCRNVLIYLNQDAQKAMLDLLHFALRPEGILVLGTTESAEHNPDLFELVSKEGGIYRARRRVPTTRHHGLRSWFDHRSDGKRARRRAPSMTRERALAVIEQFVLGRHAAASVAINQHFEIAYAFGLTQNYLLQPAGELRVDLLSLLRPGLYPKLKEALASAVESGKPVRVSNMLMERDGASVRVECTIERVPGFPPPDGMFLVVFRDLSPLPVALTPERTGEAKDPLLHELESALEETRVELRRTVEQLEKTNEEYQESHEELIALNQDLQSGNEELETSREELRSLNKEVVTVNRELEQRNSELQAVNADLTNLLVSTEIPTIFLDKNLRIRRFTPAATSVMRLAPSDVGRSIEDIRERFRESRMLEDVASVLETLIPASAELETEEGRWYRRTVHPYRTTSGKVDGVTITFGEITEQKAAAVEIDQERVFAEAIIATVRTPLLVLDEELRVVKANRSFLEMFGVSEDALRGREIYEFGERQWDIPAVRTLLDEALPESREIRDYVIEHEFEGLGRRVMLVNAWKMAEGAQRRLNLLAIEDITARHESERVILQRSEELAEEHHRKDEFLAMLGHELRNPLAALIHGLDLLGKPPDEAERRTRLREMMLRQAKKMSALLDQLLDVARVVSGKIEIASDRVDLVEVVRRAVETVTPFIDARRHELVVDLPADTDVRVQCDAIRLSQVFENLLTNAAKYTKPGGRIELALQTSNGEVSVSVRDNGVGIEPQFLPHLFELFTQAKRPLDRAAGGLGLGLPLVQRLVELHGGRVEASSPGLDRGSEFIVTLPRIAQRRSPIPPRPTNVAARRVLVVDDEHDAADALKELLTLEGHDALASYDGPSTLDAVRTFRPEAVFLDLGLPRMDGYEVAKKLREEHGSGVLLVALTGYQRDEARLTEAGFDDHLIKPPSFEKIRTLLEGSKT